MKMSYINFIDDCAVVDTEVSVLTVRETNINHISTLVLPTHTIDVSIPPKTLLVNFLYTITKEGLVPFFSCFTITDGELVIGDKGDRGPSGPRGLDGESGKRGKEGSIGEIGSTGKQGERGRQGPRGESVTKFVKGPRGPRGPKGKPGIKGETGDKGRRGQDSNVKGETGPTGNNGPTGEVGDRGRQGLEGPSGSFGEQGEVGDNDNYNTLALSVTHLDELIQLNIYHSISISEEVYLPALRKPKDTVMLFIQDKIFIFDTLKDEWRELCK